MAMGVYEIGDLIVSQEFQQKKVISGRKIHLEEIRHKLLHKFKKYMRLILDEVLNNLPKWEMLKCLKNIGSYVSNDEQANENTLKEKSRRFWKNTASDDVAWMLNSWKSKLSVNDHCLHAIILIQSFSKNVMYLSIFKQLLNVLARCLSNERQIFLKKNL